MPKPMKHHTTDRGRYYTTSDLGAKRSTTPEGFLVCHDVPIARTGIQLYTGDEVPIDPGPDGLIRIERLPEEVFREETVRSFEGKPVTVEHPNDFVTPDNWGSVAVGITTNVRRGEGIQDDLLIADLVITDKAAIEYVNKELPEVSSGYQAVYQQTDAGRGLQRDIVGNHVALVERGRAGPRCSIQDKEPTMSKTTPKKRTWMDRLRTAFKAQDEAAMEEALEEAKAKKTGDEDGDDDEDDTKSKTGDAAIAALTKAVGKLTADMAALAKAVKDAESAKEDDEDEDGKKTDDTVIEPETVASNPQAKGTVVSGDTLKAVVAKAEILLPGVQVPTGDSVKADQVEALQRRALLGCLQASENGRRSVTTFSQGRDISTLTGDALAAVFNGAAELVRVHNNDATKPGKVTTKDFGKTSTVASINERNRAYWANNTAK